MTDVVKCRLCLILNPSFQCYNVFEKVAELEMKSTVIEMISFCVPQIKDNVLSTDCICHQCLEELNACYEFIQTCISNNDIFQSEINEPIEPKNDSHIQVKQSNATTVKMEPQDGAKEAKTSKLEPYLEDLKVDIHYVQLKPEPYERLTGSELPEAKSEDVLQNNAMEVLEYSDSDMDLTELHDDSELIKSKIPEASKDRYLCAYNMFSDWCIRRQTNSLSENIFLEYFNQLANTAKPPTLMMHYSWLRATIKINNSVDIGGYLALKTFLQKKAREYVPQKRKIFTSEQVNRFIKEAPDEKFLLAKLILIMGVTGACRKHEIDHLKITDVKDLGTAAIISVRPKTEPEGARNFTLMGRSYEILKKYINLRPKKAENALCLNYQDGKCSSHKMGINKISDLVKQIARFLELPNPELFTGRCLWTSRALISH